MRRRAVGRFCVRVLVTLGQCTKAGTIRRLPMSVSRSLALVVAVLVVPSAICWAGQTTRVSVSSAAEESDGQSCSRSVSGDGRYVAFDSYASNLVPGDTNAQGDIFVHDRVTEITTRVSVSSTGQEGNDESYGASISSDGRYVAFDIGPAHV
jgi:hypothetical protein